VPSQLREIRDPVHVFVRLDKGESRVLDSRPVQRLRHIHQLGLSCLVYPGASHKRFEHSLGVMELATRVFDVVTNKDNVRNGIGRLLPEIQDEDKLRYWRRVLRVAALCHDLGHLPFSHGAEKELLPTGLTHESLTRELILGPDMKSMLGDMTPPLRAEDVAKLAVGHAKVKDVTFSNWEAILSEIITGDAFGVDRMDYLLRDSHHMGVAYGRFDHFRLIDTIRILSPPSEDGGKDLPEPAMGVELGGLQSAEAMLLARYFMYSQVYYHHVRRIYDIHLKDFLVNWLPGGQFDTDLERFIRMTDNQVTAAMVDAAYDPCDQLHELARRVVCREHFRLLYERNPEDVKKNREAGSAVYEHAKEKFGPEDVRHDKRTQTGGAPDFPVLMRDERVESSYSLSATLQKLPEAAFDCVFVSPRRRVDAEQWLHNNRDKIIRPKEENQDGRTSEGSGTDGTC